MLFCRELRGAVAARGGVVRTGPTTWQGRSRAIATITPSNAQRSTAPPRLLNQPPVVCFLMRRRSGKPLAGSRGLVGELVLRLPGASAGCGLSDVDAVGIGLSGLGLPSRTRVYFFHIADELTAIHIHVRPGVLIPATRTNIQNVTRHFASAILLAWMDERAPGRCIAVSPAWTHGPCSASVSPALRRADDPQ